MARPKTKENRVVSIRMDARIADRLDKHCEETGQSKTLAIERAVDRYIDDYDRKMKRLAELDADQNHDQSADSEG